MDNRKIVRGGQYLNICINDRGFTNKPAQISNICPTLRAQAHGNEPKVVKIIESEAENEEIRDNKTD